ncbi:5-formyltetrahydrofolate cyclo-ligase [Flavobacterium pallidum]|uniref:5-formyltetrahydrofolate cyclo-ligase n=1 Tax=Flavobacterium pallidum TaxID=2172098 RepID=A0A2S1SEY6_9FLAO|nr:5-formyltetrahydrofolate cyclo-ligase [Flavobacterium pallidum]AWI24960.1 5-formyltetrahydrofolate cyclo-ligase [Flavobacterium pallidum]
MNKKELRVKYKALRNSLSADEIEDKSIDIANRLLQLPVWDKIYYHIFLSIAEHNEVDTEPILHMLSGKDKEILVSKSDFETRDMTHFLLTDNTKFKKNDYHIPEPVDGITVPSEKIDVVFVPLLAFDTSGNRVGYGKGFYDKFLSGCRPDAIKVGLSFFEAAETWEDVFDGDVKLDYCVTPLRIYDFN